MRISLRTHNGHYLRAMPGDSYVIQADRNAAGQSESFEVINAAGPMDGIQSGDHIRLQSETGRYVAADHGGGGQLRADRWQASTWETFAMNRLDGPGEISHGDVVTLQASDSSFLRAEGGGGSTVLADRSTAREWETFTVEVWESMAVRLRAHNGQYLFAEGGGGGAVTAGGVAGAWETFALVVRNRRGGGVQNGDTVGLQAPNGMFVTATGGNGDTVSASGPVTGTWERLVIDRRSGGAGDIWHGDQVSLQTSNGRYMCAVGGGGGPVVADRPGVGDWETFTVEVAEQNPTAYALAPYGGPGHPFQPEPPLVTTPKRVLTLLVSYADSAPIDETLTADVLRDVLFGNGVSLRTWYETNSLGCRSIVDVGVHGPVQLPYSFDHYHDMGDGFPNAVAYDAIAAIRGTLATVERADAYLVFDFNGRGMNGGAKREVDVFIGWVRYNGPGLFLGLFLHGGERQGRDQIDFNLVVHESSHVLVGLVDRYNVRAPIMGDMIANRYVAGAWETFVIDKPDGAGGAIVHGDQVTLRSRATRELPAGAYVVAVGGGGGLVNADSAAPGGPGTFTIVRTAGAGPVQPGDTIGLQCATGQYVMAVGGGGRELRADGGGLRAWETLVVRKFTNGNGDIVAGDGVTLTSNSGHFVCAEARKEGTPAVGPAGPYWLDSRGGGWGVGGAFDPIDQTGGALLTAYDRIREGWIRPRFLSPDDRGSYLLQPSIRAAEAFVLWDPHYPSEWYVVENRQHDDAFDPIPGSGLAITWVDETLDRMWYPALISAMASSLPANPLLAPPTLDARWLFKRMEQGALFGNERVVLRRGDGGPSRFHLGLHVSAGGNASVSIR